MSRGDKRSNVAGLHPEDALQSLRFLVVFDSAELIAAFFEKEDADRFAAQHPSWKVQPVDDAALDVEVWPGGGWRPAGEYQRVNGGPWEPNERHYTRMAAEMGAALLAILPCAFAEKVGEHAECSWQPHHARSFARDAWHYAVKALAAPRCMREALDASAAAQELQR